ncbi:hypothetical protein ED873_21225 [Escherichia coli]|nr:hypothetical protein [Escherichia coli]HAU4501866.1 hypothetical protein [Citrobacter freundii]
MFAGKKSAQIREILISESAWEEMTCLFAPSLGLGQNREEFPSNEHLQAQVAWTECKKPTALPYLAVPQVRVSPAQARF